MARAVEVRITGVVQGVSFRMYAAEEARRLGVTGWVRNESDGSVRCHVEGDQEAVARMLEWCRHGPPSARVEGVDVEKVAEGGGSGFEVEH